MHLYKRWQWVAAAVVGWNAAAFAQQEGAEQKFHAGVDSLNPDISAIVDGFFYHDDSEEGMAHVKEELSGFGHAHGEGDHDHGEIENGFNLRHLELMLTAEVDPFFKATAIAAVDTHGAEMEEASVETLGLPLGLKLKAGKFYSGFGLINEQHAHDWAFTDQPLIYELALGTHGLNEKGAQLSWLAPAPFHLLAGVEAFQGENEKMFAHHGGGPLPEHDGPRLWVGWVKVGPAPAGPHDLQFGVSAGTGKHQEEHDGDVDGGVDHWLDGDSTFWGADVLYAYDDPRPHGHGDFSVQGEYFRREKDLDLVAHDLAPALVGRSRVDEQDGYYVQAVYGFLPRLRGGVRWEQVGLTNRQRFPDGTEASFGSSNRLGVMVDYSPTEFSRLRVQVNRGSYETEEGRESALEGFVQLTVMLGGPHDECTSCHRH